MGSLFGIKRPLPTATFETAVDPATGKEYVKSNFTPAVNSLGAPLYTYTTTSSSGAPVTANTTCSTGSPDAAGTSCIGTTANPRAQAEQTPFVESFLGNSAKPRLSIGVGVNWNSPFGPLRIDLAKALLTQKGDDPKLITFNVGTQF